MLDSQTSLSNPVNGPADHVSVMWSDIYFLELGSKEALFIIKTQER